MTIAIAFYVREPLRGVALPLATVIGEDASIGDVLKVVEELKGLVGVKILDKLDRLFDEALKEEIWEALNTDNLERDVPILSEKFLARIALPMVELSNSLYTRMYASDRNVLMRFREIEKGLAKTIAGTLRLSEYEHTENLVYALSVLVDRDLWVLDKVVELGFEGLVSRLLDRALSVVLQLAGYTMYLAFAWVSASSAVLGLVKEYKEGNRDTLATWCRVYAKEVEGYLDTLDLLLDDEVYSDLLELDIVKR